MTLYITSALGKGIKKQFVSGMPGTVEMEETK